MRSRKRTWRVFVAISSKGEVRQDVFDVDAVYPHTLASHRKRCAVARCTRWETSWTPRDSQSRRPKS